MDWLLLGGAGVIIAVLIGFWLWLNRQFERQLKRDLDRMLFPAFHENRMLRQRLRRLESGEDAEFTGDER